jgi:hypothetical protein
MGRAVTERRDSAMQIHRHRNARTDDALLRFEHENDLVRPYDSLPLTTQTSATTFLRRVSPTQVAIVSRGGARLVDL